MEVCTEHGDTVVVHKGVVCPLCIASDEIGDLEGRVGSLEGDVDNLSDEVNDLENKLKNKGEE